MFALEGMPADVAPADGGGAGRDGRPGNGRGPLARPP
jgi:hypothetical protein